MTTAVTAKGGIYIILESIGHGQMIPLQATNGAYFVGPKHLMEEMVYDLEMMYADTVLVIAPLNASYEHEQIEW